MPQILPHVRPEAILHGQYHGCRCPGDARSRTMLKHHDHVIKWKHFPRLLAIESPPHKGHFRRAFDFFFDLRLEQTFE